MSTESAYARCRSLVKVRRNTWRTGDTLTVTDVLIAVKKHAKLTTLKVRASLASEADAEIVFELEHGGEPAARWHLSAEELSLPSTRDQVLAFFNKQWFTPSSDALGSLLSWAAQIARPSWNPAIPDRVLVPLKTYLSSYFEDPVPTLWLELGEPAGYLWMLPWERLLQKSLSVRVLRLPYLATKPLVTRKAVEAVLCCTATPRSKEKLPADRVVRIIRSVGDSIPRVNRVHVFADSAYRDELIRAIDGMEASRKERIVVHGESSRPPDSERSKEHPWTHWLRHALENTAVDVVHFVFPVSLSGEGSSLTVAQNPFGSPDGPVRAVSPRDVAEFLTRFGPAAAFFTASPGFLDSIASRHMIDQVAHLRPGPLVLHESDLDQDDRGLMQCYGFLFADGEAPLPATDAVAMICHPWQGVETSLLESSIPAAFQTAREAVREVMDDGSPTPSWVAITQRYLETETSNCLEAEAGLRGEVGAAQTAEAPTRSRLDEAALKGAKEAIQFVSEALAQNVRFTGSSGKE
jgi:hypothetical protein